MATYRIKFVIIFLLFSTIFLHADNELEKIYENILITYAKIKTYEADFIQENTWKEINTTKESSGKAYFDTENFLLKYAEPKGQILLIEESGITLYDSASNQAMISDRSNAELRPDKLIAEYWNNSIKKIKLQEDDLLIIQFTTADGSEIHVAMDNFLINNLRVIDKNGNTVLYAFSNVKINQALPDNIFEITLPEDASVIDNRTK